MATQLWAILLVLFGTLVGSFGPVLLKKASKKITLNPITWLKNKHLLIGFSLYAASTIIFIPALKGGDLSVLYPFVATAYIWVSLWSVKFLKEKMTAWKWFGIILIIIGVSLIGLGS